MSVRETTTGAILITGATGNVGRQVMSQLRHAGAVVRAMTRNPGSAKLPENVEVVRGDLSDAGTLDAALDAVESVFLVWPFNTAEAAPAVLDVVKRHARRVVYLSSMSVRDDVEEQTDPISAFHAEIERLIEESGLEWTFLRCSGLATNTLGWAEQIRADGIVRWTYGEAARSLIHERDVAAVAVHALTEVGHSGRKYILTGPEALTQVEQVHAIGEAIDRPLRWEEISPEVARKQMIAGGWTPSFADGALDYWAKLMAERELVTHAVEEITGSPARTFRQWAIDHANDFS